MNGIYVAAAGALSQLAGLDITAQNLANVGTAGFRRFLNVVQSVQGHGSPYEYAAADPSPRLDLTQGPLQATGNPLDFAISGPAFLTVQTPDGPAYTRNGELAIGPDGTLMAAGNPVMSEGGGTVTMPSGVVSIGGDGSINVAGQPVARMALADPAGTTMMPIGGSLYRPAEDQTLPASTGDSQIHQGFIERSTGTEAGEMVSLMNVMRSYEAAMKSVTSIDDNQNRAIQTFTLQA
jgi:flagellar basal-body rod protein FlgF